MRPERVVIHGFGDSLTAAIADVWTNQRLRPWHEILSELIELMGLQTSQASQLARTGATSEQILREQIPQADIAPGDLVCLWVGGNDVLRSGFTAADSERAIAEIFDAVRAARGIPLTMELPRISSALPGPRFAMRSWDRHGATINRVTESLSTAIGGIHLSWPGARVTGPDGTHLSQAAHYEYAERYANALADRWVLPAPVGAVPQGLPIFTPGERRRWYLQHGWRWMLRRRRDQEAKRRST